MIHLMGWVGVQAYQVIILNTRTPNSSQASPCLHTRRNSGGRMGFVPTNFSSYLNLFQPRPGGKLSPPYTYRHVQPIFETFRLAWPSPVANGKLSLGDVEATVAGTFDVDQSALANKVLHYVNVTRYSETRTH